MPGSFVNVNDIFDIGVIQQRLKYAHGGDGKDFWKKFFLCKGHCAGQDTVIYVFTYDQLRELYIWWRKKIRKDPSTNRRSFNRFVGDKGKKGCLIDNLTNFNAEAEENNRFLSEINVCLAEFTYSNYVEFKRVLFSLSTERELDKGIIDFFHADFTEEKKDITEEAEREQKLKTLLEEGSKGKIEETFVHGRIIRYILNQTKWLRYLKKNKLEFKKDIAFEHKNLEYCMGFPNCPLISKLSSAGTTVTGASA
jgi:hypothetical protein